MATSQSPPPPWTLIKTGWIKKYKTKKLKYFVLSKDSKGNVYLEYFESEKKSRLPSTQLSNLNGSTVITSTNSRTINILDTFYIQKRVQQIKSNKIEYIVDIFTRSDVFVLLFEDESDQKDWFDTIMKEKSDWFKMIKKENGNCVRDEMFEDSFDYVWQVMVTKKGIGGESGLTGLNRLCFTSKVVPNMVLLYKVEPIPSKPIKPSPSVDEITGGQSYLSGQGVYNQSMIEMPLNQVRKVARNGSMFHIELGRSSTIGEGALYMVPADEISCVNIHDTIRNAMSFKASSQRSSVIGSHPPIAQSSVDGHRQSDGNHGYLHSHTSSPASSPPSITILNQRSNSIGKKDESSSWLKSGRSDSVGKKTLTEGDDIYVPMGPSATAFDPPSSMEEQGYLEMTVTKKAGSSISSSVDQDGCGYLDMSPVSSSLSNVVHGTHSTIVGHSNAGPCSSQHSSTTGPHHRSRTGTSGSIRSNERRSRTGKSIFDVDPPELPPMTTTEDEFRLEKVKSFLEESNETELHPVRAYSIGSRPSPRQHFISRHGHNPSNSPTAVPTSVAASSSSSVGTTNTSSIGPQRVRSNTVGSRPPAFSPTSLSAASSTSSHLLSSNSKLTSSSNDHVDHMEIDYTGNSGTVIPSNIGVRKLSQGHRARSDSKSSTSSTTSAGVKFKESEPWEAHLPSGLALHSSPLNTGTSQQLNSGHPTAASSMVQQQVTVPCVTVNQPKMAAEGKPVASSDSKPVKSFAQSSNENSSSAADTSSAADSSTSSSVTISSSSSIASTTVPMIGPVRPPGHSQVQSRSGSSHNKTTKSGTTTTATVSTAPISRTVSHQPSTHPSAPPYLPSLPEATSGSIGSLNSIMKETSPELLQQSLSYEGSDKEKRLSGNSDKDRRLSGERNRELSGDSGRRSSGENDRRSSGDRRTSGEDEETVQYTVIQFNPNNTTTSSSSETGSSKN